MSLLAQSKADVEQTLLFWDSCITGDMLKVDDMFRSNPQIAQVSLLNVSFKLAVNSISTPENLGGFVLGPKRLEQVG